MKVVSNASVLIALSSTGQMHLLSRLFGRVLIPESVCHEVVRRGEGRPGASEVAEASWIETRVTKAPAPALPKSTLSLGEADALALGHELGADLMLLDDREARAGARQLGLPLVGTLGILKLAYKRGLLRNPWPRP